MSDKLRSVNTKFWDDSFVQDLTPSEKLLFLYLLTNPLTNLLGVYEITEKRITFDTGLNLETIRKSFERFGKNRKAYFLQNYIILPNWLKNQRLNTNMRIAVAREFNNLPNELKNNILGNHSEGFANSSEAFGMIGECLGKYEIEIEIEKEIEKETNNINTSVKNFYKKEIENADNNHKEYKYYLSFVNTLFGENGDPAYEKVLKMKNQITFDNFCRLRNKAKLNKISIQEKVNAMENKVDLNKKYTSFYRTLNNWLVS